MNSSGTLDAQLQDLNNWQYEKDVFPLVAPTRLLNTWKLIEAWLRILQLLALLSVLIWSMLFLPDLLRIAIRPNLDQHAPALRHLQSATDQNTPNAGMETASGPLQDLKPEDSAEDYCTSVSEYLTHSRTTYDFLVSVCLPAISLGSTVGVLVSWICLPASRWRIFGLGPFVGAWTFGWLRLTTAVQHRSGGSIWVGTGDLTPGGGFPIDYSVYDSSCSRAPSTTCPPPRSA